MALGDNAIVALFDEASDLSAAVTAAVSAGRFVKISGGMQGGGPLLDVSTATSPLTGGNLMQVAQCVAGDRALGVSKWDAPTVGDVVGIHAGYQIVPMVAGAAITAGQKVMSDANGQPVPWTSAVSEANNSNGIAVSTAAGAATVYIKLRS